MIVESENEKARTEKRVSSSSPSVSADAHEVNASGYEDALDRHYSLLSITATALTIDAAWIALGGSLVVASANGGPPGIIYEFIAACAYYFFINASIAELASAIPSSGGVYHYASLTAGPKYGLLTGYFTGLLNFFGWLLGMVSITMIAASAAVEIYAQTHPALHIQSWHVFLAFLLILWACVALVVLGNRVLPALQNIGLFLIVGGGIVTIAVVAAMPRQHASSASVWTEWENTTGWPGGVAFLAGMLNGAYAIGTPDAITHMAEEMPHPRRDLPKAIFMQIILGTLTGLAFAIAIMYGVSDFPAILAASSGAAFPLAAFYAQATGGNTGATVGLLLIVLLELIICTVGGIVTTGRILWTLGRDNAVPFAGTLGRASVKRSCPVYATLAVGVLATVFGAIRLGNALAFNDLVGSFVILTTTSYLLAILPHMLTGRKNVSRGPFWMGRWGYLVNGLAVLCIAVTDVFYCFPYFRPVDASSMNYNFVILLGIVGLSALWWVVHAARHYRGPRVQHLRESVVFVDGER